MSDCVRNGFAEIIKDDATLLDAVNEGHDIVIHQQHFRSLHHRMSISGSALVLICNDLAKSPTSLAMSLPVLPMANPMSACLRAGESLTPGMHQEYKHN